ncbi:MAG: SDR family NAD(P)-dependent oxidoreductase [Pseudomonadales bacterium]
MKDFEGQVAAITGGASGIGYAMAEAALERGMKVSIADVEQEALDRATAELSKKGEVLAVQTDVSSAEAMDNFAARTFDAYGSVQVLFNNAGVDGHGAMWDLSTEDWEWTLGVNLWGVIHGIRVFSKHMVEQNIGHIVNTASIAGLVSAPSSGPYTVSKHAVVALSEVLHGELRNESKNVGVSVLCPSYVSTNIITSSRNRSNVEKTPEWHAEQKAVTELAAPVFAGAMQPQTVAQLCFDAIESGRFYILPHREGSLPIIEQRMTDILEDGLPSMRGPEEYPFN